MKSCRGFTLIELLAVITIIAVLASLLLPVLARSKGKARQTQCLNNLRQFSIGCVIYTDENEDVLPRERAFADVESWNTADHHPWAVAAANTKAEVWVNSVARAAGRRPLADHASSPGTQVDFYAADSHFHCPETKCTATN